MLAERNRIFTGYDNISLSTDTGSTWKKVFSPNYPSHHIPDICTTDGKLLFAAVLNEGVVVSKDSGNTWSFLDTTGLTSLEIWSVEVGSGYLYAGTNGAIFRRPLIEIITGTPSITNEFKQFEVKVYPNPFRHFTNIEFGRALHSGRISIYDMSGREVKIISDISADKIVIEQGNLLAGTYVYILSEEGKKMATGKLIIES